MAIVPDDELCIQQMLGIEHIPEVIEKEYLIRARMLHRQLAGGPIGPIAIVDMLRHLDFGPPPPRATNGSGQADWRMIDDGTPVEIHQNGKWIGGDDIKFAGEIGSGTLAVDNRGRIDEFNSFEVRLPEPTLPSDLNPESFVGTADKPQPDARIGLIGNDDDELIGGPDDDDLSEEDDPPEEFELDDTDLEGDGENEVENQGFKGEIGSDDETPPNVEQAVNWGNVKKGTPIWLRDGEDMKDAQFQRCVKPGKAVVLVQGEEQPREVERAFMKLP